MGWRRRVDSNHGEIVQALRACGWLIADTSRLPNFVDLVGLRDGKIRLFEIKSAKGKFTESQDKLMAQWPVIVLRDIADVARL